MAVMSTRTRLGEEKRRACVLLLCGVALWLVRSVRRATPSCAARSRQSTRTCAPSARPATSTTARTATTRKSCAARGPVVLSDAVRAELRARGLDWPRRLRRTRALPRARLGHPHPPVARPQCPHQPHRRLRPPLLPRRMEVESPWCLVCPSVTHSPLVAIVCFVIFLLQ